MASEVLLIEHLDDATTRLTLNRPDRRNALSIELMEVLSAEFALLATQSNRRVVILRGAGPAFCAGLDLNEAAQPELAERSAQGVARLFETIATSPLITIAAAQGAAYAGGAGLLACCDFVIASDDLKIAFPEVRRGLVPALVAVLLRDRLSDSHTRELLLIAEPVAVDRARAMGLVQQVVVTTELDTAACALALTVLKGMPQSVRSTKQLLHELRSPDFSQQLAHALEFHKRARSNSEATAGVSAFLNRRGSDAPE